MNEENKYEQVQQDSIIYYDTAGCKVRPVHFHTSGLRVGPVIYLHTAGQRVGTVIQCYIQLDQG